MAPWLDVIWYAFLLQLLALPGEKGQIIIAGLATRYNPYTVVAGAATAFGGWTVVEILLGDTLKGALPEIYLDAITAILFLIFAVLITYSESTMNGDKGTDSSMFDASPGSDMTANGGRTAGFVKRIGDIVPEQYHGFISAFSMMVFGEFGDKTQLVTIGLAVQYGAHPGIWIGEMLAIVPVSLLTALFFHKVSHRFNTVWFHRIAATLFVLFAADIASKYILGMSFLPF